MKWFLQQDEQRPLASLTLLYLAALGIIAALVILSQLIILQPMLDRASTDAEVINVAGRQRTLSQRISKAALALQVTDGAERDQYLSELETSLALWTATHANLRSENSELGAKAVNDPVIDGLFVELEAEYQAMSGAAACLVFRDVSCPTSERAVQIIRDNEAGYLTGMEAIVAEFEANAHTNVEQAVEIGRLWRGILLIVVVLQAVFVFRPAIRRAQVTVSGVSSERSLLRTLIDNVPDYIFAKDRQGRFLISNIAHAQAAGVSNPEALVGKTAQEVFPSTLAGTFASDDQEVMEKGRSLISEERQTVDVDGRTKWVLTTKVPLRDSDGTIIGLVGISHDITERRQAQQALAAERNLLYVLMNNFPDLIYFKDTASKFTRISQAHAHMLGVETPEEAVGKTDFDFQPRELAESFFAEEQEIVRTGEPLIDRIEYNPTPEGKPRWFSATKVPIKDADGQVIGMIGVSRDITERRRSEDALRESEERFRQLAENVSEVFWLRDAKTGEVLYISPAYETIWGHTVQELINDLNGVVETIHPEDRGRFMARLENPTSSWHEDEFRIIRPDGQIRWIRSQAFPVKNEQGEIYRVVGISEDITLRKNAQDALRESERSFQQLAGNIKEVFWIADAKTMEVTYMSPAYEAIWGPELHLLYEAPDVLTAIAHPDDVERVRQLFRDKLDNFEAEFRIVRPDEAIRWLRLRAFSVNDENGEVYRIVGTAEDITERKEAQEATRKQQELYRLLVTNLPGTSVYLYDADLRYLLVEGSSLENTYYSKEAMEGKTLWDIVPHDRAVALAPLYETAFTGQAIAFDWESLEGRFYAVQVLPVRNPDGSIFAGMMVTVDITESRKSQEGLSRLAAIVESSQDAIIGKTLDGIITSWNPGAFRLYGYTAKETVGQSISMLVPEDRPDEIPGILAKLRQGDAITAYETVRRRKNGELVDVALSISPVRDGNGRLIGAAAIARDISERKQSEARLMELSLEREKVNMLSHFISDASHDLRTPISVIKSSMYLLEKHTDPQKKQNQMTRINEQADRLQGLVEEMFTLAWLDQSAMHFDSQPCDLNAVVRDVIQEQQGIAERHQQQIDFDASPERLLIAANREKLTNAIRHIVVNAMNYSQDGSEIGLRTYRNSHNIAVEIRDSGIGIAPADLQHIFDRFFRVDKARGTNQGGMGLGLSIAKKIVEAHNGRIEVVSEVGVGSTFTIWLPVDGSGAEVNGVH